MGRLSRLHLEVDVAHDGGDAAAEELFDLIRARVERAIRDEGAEPFGSSGHVEAIGPDAGRPPE